MTRQFHIGDVLSVTTGRLLSPRGMDGVYDILNFMMGCNLFTHQLPRAATECKPYLLQQFPQLDHTRGDMTMAYGYLIGGLDSEMSENDTKALITGWIVKLFSGCYGVKINEYVEVEPMPDAIQTRLHMDPIVEIAMMMEKK